MAVVNLPFVPVFLYGMFTESVPICNSRKKNYIIIMGVLSMAILMTILIHNESLESVDYVFLIGMLTANSFAMAV